MMCGRRRDEDAVEIDIGDKLMPIGEYLAAFGNDVGGVRVTAGDACELGPTIFGNGADDVAAPAADADQT